MRKLLLITLAMFAAFIANAEEVKVTWNGQSDWNGVADQEATISYTYNGIAITVDKADGGTKPTVNANANDLRAYAKNTVRITSEIGNMTNISFELSAQGQKRLPELTATNGEFAYDVENANVTWIGDVADLTITVGEKATLGSDGASKAGQFDILSLTVTTSAAPAIAMPIFSINGGTFYEPVEVEITCSTDGAAIYYTLDGTTPDESKTLYQEAITISETATLKAVAVKEGETSGVNEATYTIEAVPEVADITAFLATNTTEAAKTDIYRIVCPVTVMYQFDRYLYVTDGTKSLQVYGSLNNTYTNGDVLEGICGSVGYYNGTYQMTPVTSSFGEATEGTPVQPTTVTVQDITNNMVSDYIRLTKVSVTQDKTFTDATGSIDAYKRFDVELPEVGSDTYTVEGFVSNYKGTLQIFPTKITNTTALNATQAVAERAYAVNGCIKTHGNNETVSVYNVTGKLVATGMAGSDIKVNGKGIYIVKVGNKATKVVVR